jgi:integrase
MKPEADTMTLREAFNAFIRPELEGRTVEAYESALTRWERRTTNPTLPAIDNVAVAAFRKAMIDAGLAPATANGTWRHLRAVLRRCGPPAERNPWGLSLIPRVPAMKVLKEIRKFPRIFRHDELNRLYEACETRTYPEDVVPAADWWRALLTLSLNAGPRPGDLFRLTPESIDWERGTLTFLQSKVRAWHFVPLTDATRLHLERIRSDREFLFPAGQAFRRSKNFYRNWRALQETAGVDPAPFFTFRKTCATCWDRIERGLGAYILGHSLRGTAATYYLNVTDDLFAAAKQLRQPEAFTRIVDDPKLQRNVVCRPTTRATEWEFTAETATWKGTTLRFRDRSGRRVLRVLQLLVSAKRPLTFADFQRLAFWEAEVARQTIKGLLHRLQNKLTAELQLPPLFDPIANARDGSGYFLKLP